MAVIRMMLIQKSLSGSAYAQRSEYICEGFVFGSMHTEADGRWFIIESTIFFLYFENQEHKSIEFGGT